MGIANQMDRQVITVRLQVELSEHNGHWRARLPEGPHIEVNGKTREEALTKAKALALRAIADRADSELGPRTVGGLFEL